MKNMHPQNAVVAGDGAQQVALALASPSAGDSHPVLGPVPDQFEDFWTWEKKAVKTQAMWGASMLDVKELHPCSSAVSDSQHSSFD